MDALRSHVVGGAYVMFEGFASLEAVACSFDVRAGEVLGCPEVDELELMALR